MNPDTSLLPAMQVPILDAGIHISAGYTPYDEGIAQDVFIKDVTGQPYVGQVGFAEQIFFFGKYYAFSSVAGRELAMLSHENDAWLHRTGLSKEGDPVSNACHAHAQLWPGAIHWPDYMAARAVAWWTAQLTALYNELPLDGVWLDMNEPSNFCTGDVCAATGASLCMMLQVPACRSNAPAALSAVASGFASAFRGCP